VKPRRWHIVPGYPLISLVIYLVAFSGVATLLVFLITWVVG